MAKIKISELPSASAFSGANLIPIVQSGVTKKGTMTQLVSYVGGALFTGSSSQFVKADGSFDSTSYTPTGSISGTTGRLAKFTSSSAVGDSIVSESGSALSVGGTLQINVATGYNALFQQSGTDLRINYLNQDLSANVSASYRAIGYNWQDNGGSGIMTLSSTKLITFGASNTGEAHIFGGSARVNGNTSIYGSNQVTRFVSSTTAFYSTYVANSVDLGYIGNGTGLVSGGNATDFGIRAETNLIFAISNTERMRIVTSGNVLIGTTTDDGVHKLQVNGNILLIGRVTSEVLTTGAAYFEAKNTLGSSYFGNDSIGAYLITEWNAPILFYTNNVDRGRWSAGGNLLIGTTTDDGVNKLQVSGSATFSSSVITGGNIQINKVSPRFELWNTTTSNGAYSVVVTNTNIFRIENDFAGTIPFQISGAGAATFSSSVTANSFISTTSITAGNDIFAGNNKDLYFRNFSNSADIQAIGLTTGDEVRISSGGGLTILGGAIKTEAPASSTAGEWKLGTFVAGSSFTLNDSAYIEVEIDGNIYKLALIN